MCQITSFSIYNREKKIGQFSDGAFSSPYQDITIFEVESEAYVSWDMIERTLYRFTVKSLNRWAARFFL